MMNYRGGAHTELVLYREIEGQGAYEPIGDYVEQQSLGIERDDSILVFVCFLLGLPDQRSPSCNKSRKLGL
jgi:hypothetical protein